MNDIKYSPGDSLLHRLDPRVKVIVLVLLTLLVFVVKTFAVIGILFFTVVLFWFNAKMPLSMISTYLKFMMSLFAILIVLQSIFYPGETILLKPLIPAFVPLLGGVGNITMEGFLFGLLLCLRVLTLICLLPLLLYTTPIEDFARALVKMGLPYKIAFIATTALNQIPILQQEIKSIMNAQKLRGFTVFEEGKLLEKFKAYPALVVPLVIGSMRRSQMMGIAMDARAFGTSPDRTYINDIEMDTKDWAGLIGGIAYCTGLLILNFVIL